MNLRLLSRWLAAVLVSVVVVSYGAVPASGAAQGLEAPAAQTTVNSLLSSLTVTTENGHGYNRDFFNLWTSSSGCDTRERVLARQNVAPFDSGDCGAERGRWVSAYDGTQTTDSGDFDIDHMVPLAEAWDSGARTWTSQRREAYANDTTYRLALIAVSASSNRSKGEKDPAEWMPQRTSYWCTYLRSWVGVKFRWQLSIDTAEKAFLTSHLQSCSQTMATPPVATIDAGAPTPPPSVSASPRPPVSSAPVRYANCTFARGAGVTPIVESHTPELYALNSFMDRDHDGVACE